MKKKNKKSGKKTSCQQEPSFPEGKIKREEPREKACDQAKISSATQISPRERRDGSQSVETVSLSEVRPKARSARAGSSGGGGGDYSGLSPVEGADSESPRELLEEGQTFEAGIVQGVQNAPNADQGEIRTREVPEDDVPWSTTTRIGIALNAPDFPRG